MCHFWAEKCFQWNWLIFFKQLRHKSNPPTPGRKQIWAISLFSNRVKSIFYKDMIIFKIILASKHSCILEDLIRRKETKKALTYLISLERRYLCKSTVVSPKPFWLRQPLNICWWTQYKNCFCDAAFITRYTIKSSPGQLAVNILTTYLEPKHQVHSSFGKYF